MIPGPPSRPNMRPQCRGVRHVSRRRISATRLGPMRSSEELGIRGRSSAPSQRPIWSAARSGKRSRQHQSESSQPTRPSPRFLVPTDSLILEITQAQSGSALPDMQGPAPPLSARRTVEGSSYPLTAVLAPPVESLGRLPGSPCLMTLAGGAPPNPLADNRHSSPKGYLYNYSSMYCTSCYHN